MTRLQYCAYLLRRVAEACMLLALAAIATHYAQVQGWIEPANHAWLYRSINWCLKLFHRHLVAYPGWIITLEWWTWPALISLGTHLLFGPKQQRPIHLRIPGFTYIYGGIAADRNAACRGGLITGATGSGKSEVCVNPLLHSVTINESGRVRKGWLTSKTRPLLDKARTRFRTANEADRKSINKLAAESEKAFEAANKALDNLVADLLVNIIEWQALHPGQPFTPAVAGPLADELNQMAGFTPPPDLAKKPFLKATWNERQAKRAKGEMLAIDRSLIMGLIERVTTVQRLEAPAPIAGAQRSPHWNYYTTYCDKAATVQEIEERIASLTAKIAIRRLEFQKIADPLKPLRYEVPPWGGIVADEKGNQWQTVSAMFGHHNRDEDLMLLQTRPADAPPDWIPPARFNLLSFDDLPADTYAKLIVDTGLAIEGGDKPDEFFVPQARDKIGWGLKLMRAVREAQIEIGEPPERRLYPAIDKILHILTTLTNYNGFLIEVGAAPSAQKSTVTRSVKKVGPNGQTIEEPETVETETIIPARLNTPALREARARLENDYWAQPDDQRGGVASTIYNFLVPFTEAEIAAVFCRDSTFDLRSMNEGKVISVALPQKYAVQRRYAIAILKTIGYQLIQNRFDLRSDQRAWNNRNLIMLPQDEFQRYAIEADTQVDTIRQAQGTTYAAAQTQDAIWRSYGGKEKAVPMLANLRTRFICTAATESCAEESSRLIGKHTAAKYSHTVQLVGANSTNVSYEDRYFIKPHELMALPAFTVVFAPAESRFLYKKLIVMPITTDARIPAWWFGDWNPFAWLHIIKPKNGREIIWPWRAKAPVRAMIRYLLGFDGTFIVLEKMSRRRARKLNHKEK